MQQSDSLCLAVNPPPFDKGGKGVGVGQGLVGDLSVVYILHCNRKNRVLCRTRLILTVDILFWRYPLAVLLYCKVKMRCQLRLAFDSSCNAYLLTGFDLASLFDLKRLVKSVVMRFVSVAVIYHNAYSPQRIVLYLLDLTRAGGFYIRSDRCGDVHSVVGLPTPRVSLFTSSPLLYSHITSFSIGITRFAVLLTKLFAGAAELSTLLFEVSSLGIPLCVLSTCSADTAESGF